MNPRVHTPGDTSVNVMTNPVTTMLMSKGQCLSPDARCKSFDRRANGYARGEGAGILVLKSLAVAVRDGDRIHTVVRGTAVNQDGRTPGITVPSVDAQRAVIRQACAAGGVDPASIGYFEGHGTGTAVGDPVEATAIGSVLGDSDRTHWLGSVKSNFGHTEEAAGVAGVIKAVLCLERGLVPPNPHFEKPNPSVPVLSDASGDVDGVSAGRRHLAQQRAGDLARLRPAAAPGWGAFPLGRDDPRDGSSGEVELVLPDRRRCSARSPRELKGQV